MRRLVAEPAENLLQLQMDAYLQAGWNKRTAIRLGYRNGYYLLSAMIDHNPLRSESAGALLRDRRFDSSIVFDRCRRRIRDVERILRHAYPLGAWQNFTFHRLSRLRRTIGPTSYRNCMVAEAVFMMKLLSKEQSLANCPDGIKLNLHIILDVIVLISQLVLRRRRVIISI